MSAPGSRLPSLDDLDLGAPLEDEEQLVFVL